MKEIDNFDVISGIPVTKDLIEPIEYVWNPELDDPAERMSRKVGSAGYRFFFDDVVIVKRVCGKNSIAAYRAHDITAIADETDASLSDNTCVIRYDHPVGTGYSLCVIPLCDAQGLEAAKKRAVRKLDHLFGDATARLGSIYLDIRRVRDIAAFCGCGTDIASFISAGKLVKDVDTLFCAGAVTVIALMFRRIGLRRGFNLKTDVIDFTVYLTFNALVYEKDEACNSDDELIDGLPEIDVLKTSANARGIPLNVSVIRDDKCEGARRIVVRFCALNDPYRQKYILSARDRSERGERIRRIRRLMNEFPFDFSGKY